MQIKLSFLLGFLLLLAAPASALRLPEVLSDHMILQQNTEVSLWGWELPGKTVTIETSWGVKTQATANAQGEWRAKVATPAATPLSQGLHPEHITFTTPNLENLTIRDILIGEVWLCSGQSNMDMILKAGYPKGWAAWYGEKFWETESQNSDRPGLRTFDIANTISATPQADCVSAFPRQILQPLDGDGFVPASKRGWQTCTPENAPFFRAVPYYFAAAIQEKLDVPVGLMTPMMGGTRIEGWMSLEAVRSVPGYENASPTTLDDSAPSGLYNGLIAPLTKMTIRGAIWYQGESNIGNARYAQLFKTLISSWRSDFNNPDMPFYFVQIAPFNYKRVKQDAPAELREAQASALKLKNTGMALSIDVGETNNIHPANKRYIGRRLALQALAKTYGYADIEADGPTPESVAVMDGKLHVTFRDVGGGLISRDGAPLTCFEIADESGTYVPAEAHIDGNQVRVFSAAIAQPESVRFAWGKADVPNLMSTNGLPVAQFRVTVGSEGGLHAGINITTVGDGWGYDETDMPSFRSTDVAKGFDIDGDNVYGTEGLFFAGKGTALKTGGDFTNTTKVGAPWATFSQGANFVGIAQGYGYAVIDDPNLPLGTDIADWALESGILYGLTPTVGDWRELVKFDIGEGTPERFRIGIMSHNADNKLWWPRAIRVSVGTSANVVNHLIAGKTASANWVFFDVDLNGETKGSFSISAAKGSESGGGGSQIGGITFDVIPE